MYIIYIIYEHFFTLIPLMTLVTHDTHDTPCLKKKFDFHLRTAMPIPYLCSIFKLLPN